MATVLTQVGEEKIIDLIDGSDAVHLDSTNSHIEWGTGAGTAAKGDTDVFGPTTEARVVAVQTQSAADILQWVATITADGSKTITNAGLFDDLTAGVLVIHGDHAGQAVGLNDKIEYTITLEQT